MKKIVFLLIVVNNVYILNVVQGQNDDGGWSTDPNEMVAKPGPCNIEVRSSSMSMLEFRERYAYDAPVIIKLPDGNTEFRNLCTKQHILEEYGNKIVRLSSANSHSYKKVDIPLKEYIETMKPQRLDALGNETMYWFGDNNYTEWDSLFKQYIPPEYNLPGLTGVYSFGLAGAGTGVPFHFHGPGFGEVIYGRKRWFLYPPDHEPEFNPDKTTLHWFMEEYPKLEESQKPLECTLGPGEVIYFPDRWWHGTLNIDTSVFISTFLG